MNSNTGIGAGITCFLDSLIDNLATKFEDNNQ